MTPEDTPHAPRPADGATAGRPVGGDTADDHPLAAVVETVKHGIDQVADKVKGLLRSNR